MDDGLCTCSSGFYKQLVRLMFQDRLYFQISDDVVFILVFARRSACLLFDFQIISKLRINKLMEQSLHFQAGLKSLCSYKALGVWPPCNFIIITLYIS